MSSIPDPTLLIAAPGARPGEPDLERQGIRVRRLYLVRRRHELLAAVETVIELSDLLADEEPFRANPRLFADLAKVATSARRLAELIRDTLSPQNAEGDLAARAINHDMRSHLAVILGYADEVKRGVPRDVLTVYGAEIDQIRILGRRALGLVDSTVAQLRSPEGCPPVDEVQLYLERAAGPVGLNPDSLGPALVTGSILVAEDHEAIRNLLRDHLRAQGHAVVTARDGAEALARIAERPFDLVLTDIEMPSLDGFQLIERLNADPKLCDIPVIVVSGHGELDGVARCIKLGAEDYLPKPFNATILKARVDACLEKKHLRDQAEHQRRRYDELLHSILPAPVVDELIRTDTVRPRRVEDAAVMFADIVGFTPYCDRHQDRPEVVVQHLRLMFEAWEAEAVALGVQKIKTIGDAFMAAAGLLEDVPNPVLPCVRLGLKMIEFTQGLCDDQARPLGFNLRVGLHVGPVVSGVLGRRQSLFDLWGDTVNIAGRLESHGQPGCVNLSLAAWNRVAGLVRGETRGSCLLKGKPEPFQVVHLDAACAAWIE